MSDGNGNGEYPREWDDVEAWPSSSQAVLEPPIEWRGEERRAQLLRRAERLRDAAVDGDESGTILETLRNLNRTCIPPLRENELRQIYEESGRLKPEPFPAIRLLAGDPPPPPSIHIERWTVDRDINFASGVGGSGKSTVLCATTIACVLGNPLFGTLAVHRPGPVILCLPEDGQGVARMMIDALIEGAGLSPNDRAALAEGIFMIPDDVTVDLTQHASRLARTARDLEAVMVIADPLRTLLCGKDENDNVLAAQTVDMLRKQLCWGAGVTLELAHHHRKPGKDSAGAESTVHDVAGGGAWVNGARLVMGFQKKGNRITATGFKSNRIALESLRHEIDLAIESDPDNNAHWLTCRLTDANSGATSETLTAGRGRPLNANERAALTALDDKHEPGKRWSYSGWKEASGIKPDTWKGVKDRLLDAGLAKAVPTGLKARSGSPEYAYELTPEGRFVLVTGRVL